MEAQKVSLLKHEGELTRRTKQLEQKSREMHYLGSSLRHDLQPPLRAIQGFTLSLLGGWEQAADEELLQDAERIRGAAITMTQMIDGMDRISRITSSPFSPTPVDLRDLVARVRSDLMSREGNRSVVWKVGELPPVLADRQLLHAAITELLSNAIKFTNKCQEAVIEVSAAKTSSGTIVRVADNGAGFDMAESSKLFIPFRRLHHAAEYEGLGIGLAMVRRIIARHGGETWAEGNVGRGAAFYFSLPDGPPESLHA